MTEQKHISLKTNIKAYCQNTRLQQTVKQKQHNEECNITHMIWKKPYLYFALKCGLLLNKGRDFHTPLLLSNAETPAEIGLLVHKVLKCVNDTGQKFLLNHLQHNNSSLS